MIYLPKLQFSIHSYSCPHSMHFFIFEPPHYKTNKMTVRPVKTQISLGIHPVWSETSLFAQYVAKDPSFLHDQTGWMPRLIWVFTGWTCHFVGFVMRRLIFTCLTALFCTTRMCCQLCKADVSQWKATLHNDVRFPTVNRRIYCRKFFMLSNQMLCYIRKCIRMILYKKIMSHWLKKVARILMNHLLSFEPLHKTNKMTYSPSLIRVFAVRSKASQGTKVSSCGQRRLRSDWANLCLCWVHRSFCWFCHAAAHLLKRFFSWFIIYLFIEKISFCLYLE